jgi:hypothetical protein
VIRGLDAWIEGDGLCTYCGRAVCECEPDYDDEEREDETDVAE